MAKRQQQQDFLPSKALQPQQQIFDQYNAPKQFQAPRSELVEIGQALAGLSPTLQKFAEKDRAEDAAAMNLAASKMSIDELRAASKRDFIGLQKKGVIPEGASPWAKVALLEAAGKRLVTQTVLPELYKNLDRLSDPNNNESPEQFARSIMDAQGIDSLYAANAAEEALQPIINQFTNRVGEAKAKRTATQNRDDLSDSIYEISQTFQLGKPSEQAAVIGKLQEQLDNAHKNLGISGRNEAWSGISEAAKEMTRNGNYEGAMELLDSVGAMTVGGRAFGKDFAADIDELEDDLDTIRQAEDDIEYKRESQRLIGNTRKAKFVAGNLYQELIKTQDHLTDPTKLQEKIAQGLRDQGVAEEDIPSATTEAMTHLKSVQGSGSRDDEDTVTTISNMIIDGAPYDNIEQALDSALADKKISGSKYISLKIAAEKEGDVSGKISSVLSRDRKGNRVRNRLTTKLYSVDPIAQERLYTDVEAERILDEWEEEYSDTVRSVVTDPANADLDDDQLIRKINEAQKATDEKYFNLLSGKLEQEVPEDAPEAAVSTLQSQRAKALGDVAPEALKAETKWDVWDSEFTNVQEDFQAIAKDKTLTKKEQVAKRKELSGKLYRLAQERVNTPITVYTQEAVSAGDGLTGYRFGTEKYKWIKEKELSDSIRARAITGFSLEEIKNSKLSGDTYKKIKGMSAFEITEEGGGQDIPVELLNPKFVVLVEGMDSVEQFEDWRVTDAGKEALTAIYEAMPPQYQVGIGNFVDLQRDLLRKYR